MTASLRRRVPHRLSVAAAQGRIDRVLPLNVHVYAWVMIVGEATTTVSVPPSEVFDFVLDLNRYRQADHKIGRVGAMHRTGDTGTVRFSGRIRRLPGPAGTYPFKLSASRLQFGSPVAGAARWFLNFEGTFDCQETENGTVVTHREVFEFKRPWRWLAEPVLRRWLETDTDAEMVRFKHLLDADSNSSNAATG
jgi:Polyketide cyclase / dehydrase and lipid transport